MLLGVYVNRKLTECGNSLPFGTFSKLDSVCKAAVERYNVKTH